MYDNPFSAIIQILTAPPGLDVGAATSCCSNSQYCIIGSDFSASCCAIGSNCGNLCDSSHYQCPSSTTFNGTATVAAACCSRGCPSTSAYKCASAYGGGCCSYDSSCASSGECISTVQASTSTSVAAVVTEVPSGCTTSQITCASSLGGGCCNVGLSCTVLSNINYCAANTMMATRTRGDGTTASSLADTGSSGGLSSGAKAGIGAGVAVVALLAIGGLLMFCMAKRRNAAKSRQDSGFAPNMSQTSASAGGRKRHPSDYFGPAAAVGPYTEDPYSPMSPHSPGRNMGVPVQPHGPGDIAVPVEIDSRTTSNLPSPGTPGDFGYKAQTPHELP